jgi:hypothetical protein
MLFVGCILFTIITLFFYRTCMNHEFSPKAPETIGTEIRLKSPDVPLEGRLSKFRDLALEIYVRSSETAERIDDERQTSVPFNVEAIMVAKLSSTATLRAAQIS